jgi:hypothetical protein
LASDRFMALHMMFVRISPDAPTSEPAMIRTLLSSTKPVAAAARPEYEFRSATTTGMSAPPMGMTNMRPKMSERTARAMNQPSGAPCMTAIQPPMAMMDRNTSALTMLLPGYVSAFSK